MTDMGIAEACVITIVVCDVLCMAMLVYAALQGYVPMP